MIAKLPIEASITNTIVSAVENWTQFADLTTNYTEGGWSAASLRSFGGRVLDTSKPSCMNAAWNKKHQELRYQTCIDTPLRKAMPQVEPLIDLIPGPKERIRLMRLAAMKKILPHTDKIDPAFKRGELFRIHIPIITNDKVWFMVYPNRDDNNPIVVQLKVGGVYLLEAEGKHAVNNLGDTDRVHLVMDCFHTEALEVILINGRLLTI